MTSGQNHEGPVARWVWPLAFGLLALYVAVRMGAFTLSAQVSTPGGVVELSNTYASVDHPFHVARAETLWRDLASGHVPNWVGQHQGGYPVEFYPLGEAWLEVIVRAVSLGALPAESAHTLAVIALFLVPGIAFAGLAREDGWPPAVGLLALTLHVSLPGSWYDGGYTELVQWGLVTNVAAAISALVMLPALIRFLRTGSGWAGAAAAVLAAAAVYCNPRSLLGLLALGAGAWLAGVLRRGGWPSPPSPSVGAGEGVHAENRGVPNTHQPKFESVSVVTLRLAQIAVLAALLAAPELIALARFGDLYSFVQYSGYVGVVDYAVTAVNAVTWPVLVLALGGLALGLVLREQPATTAVATSLILYVFLTATLTLVPAAAGIAPQLEPTRLMPLQRLLTIYLAAAALWIGVTWLLARIAPKHHWTAGAAAIGMAAAILLIQTRLIAGPPPDPASPAVPRVSLYPVATSARPEQTDLEAAVRAADETAIPGTALLVLGSALSWHQQLWAPLWTDRPLFYDNWLWYWRPDHAGTPDYVFANGHHYPDAERTLDREYLSRHGVGAVVVTGPARSTAAGSPLLRRLRHGIYDAYSVIDPVATLTFGDQNAASMMFANQRVEAVSDAPASPVTARMNWHPRWEAIIDGRKADIVRTSGGYLDVASGDPISRVEFVYAVQPLDWTARILAAIGLAGLAGLAVRRKRDGRLD